MGYAALICLHALAATIWAGGHLVLCFGILIPALKKRDIEPIVQFESRYENIGIPALLILVATGFIMAYKQLPPAAWFSAQSALSRTLMVKLALLALTVTLAAHARLRLIPRLSAETLPQLAIHIVLVTTTAVAFVVTGVLHRFGGIW